MGVHDNAAMHLCFRTAIALVACLLAPLPASANELIGCWRSEEIRQFLADGRSHTSSAAAFIEFRAAEIVTRNGAPLKTSEIKYRYAVVRSGVYSATMTAHNLRPDLIGVRREYEYKVEGDRLTITTNPQTTQPAPPTAAVRVESTARRIPCPSDGQRS